jgi:chromate transporter
VATVAAVGYAAHGLAGGVIAALVAFAPSFSFILLGGPRFEQIRTNTTAQTFLDGAGPAAIGAIGGAAILLASALQQAWQFAILAAALLALLVFKRGVVQTLMIAGAIGAVASELGIALPH